MHIERLVEGVIPMRLTSILTRAMKSRISQSVVPQLWRWIEEHWNTTTNPTVKVNIPIHMPEDRRLQQLWKLETLHLRPQIELVKAASGTRHGTPVSKSTCILSNSPTCEVTTSTSGHVSPREPLEPVANWSVLGACHQASALSESWCNTQTDVVVVARTQGNTNSNTRLTIKHRLKK